jgi:Uma2 family endonuclease
MATAEGQFTDHDLLTLPRDGRKYELVDGAVRMSPAGARHGQVCVRMAIKLGSFVADRKLGHVLDSSTGFRLASGNVRSPDLSFVARGRFPDDQVPNGFASLAPDLAVEVLSPEDSKRAVLDKIGEYLEAGTRLVWVLDPQTGQAAAYRSLTSIRELSIDDLLDGEDVVPGFRCALRDILA